MKSFFALFAAAQASQELVHTASFGLTSPDVKLCKPCFSITGQGINQLLNYILNAGVVGGCSSLCAGALPAGGLPAVGCELVCSAVGVKAFVAAVSKVDLDPIYFCEVLHACPAGPDNATASLVELAAAPNPVNKGDTIKLAVHVNVTADTGVGEFRIAVDGPGSATPISQSFFLETGIPAGQQLIEVSLPLKDGQDSQGMPATFEPGQYNFSFHVCQGECGSSHPHSKDFGQLESTFALTDNHPTPAPGAPTTTGTAPPSCQEQMDEDSCKGTSTPFGACQWCDKWFMCQDAMMPCDNVV